MYIKYVLRRILWVATGRRDDVRGNHPFQLFAPGKILEAQRIGAMLGVFSHKREGYSRNRGSTKFGMEPSLSHFAALHC